MLDRNKIFLILISSSQTRVRNIGLIDLAELLIATEMRGNFLKFCCFATKVGSLTYSDLVREAHLSWRNIRDFGNFRNFPLSDMANGKVNKNILFIRFGLKSESDLQNCLSFNTQPSLLTGRVFVQKFTANTSRTLEHRPPSPPS